MPVTKRAGCDPHGLVNDAEHEDRTWPARRTCAESECPRLRGCVSIYDFFSQTARLFFSSQKALQSKK